MMTHYDEDLTENQFLKVLRNDHSDLFRIALGTNYYILVPSANYLRGHDPCIYSAENYRTHIILAHSTDDDVFVNLNKQEIVSSNNALSLCSEGGITYENCCVLFEETYFTENDVPYKLICVSQPLNIQSENAVCSVEDQNMKNITSFHPMEKVVESEKIVQSCNSSLKYVAKSKSEQECGVQYEMEYCQKLLFRQSKVQDFKFETAIQHMCIKFGRELRKEYQRSWSLVDLRGRIGVRFKGIFDKIVVRARKVGTSKIYSSGIETLKHATETYFFNWICNDVFYTLRAIFTEEESELNSVIAGSNHLTPNSLGVNESLYESIPKARKELVKLSTFLTPHGRLRCLKNALSCLRSNELANCNINSDDLLPAVIFLVVKSAFIDWNSNLCFMSSFNLLGGESDDLQYCLATFEAAVEYLKSNKFESLLYELTISNLNVDSLNLNMSLEESKSALDPQMPVVNILDCIINSDEKSLTKIYQDVSSVDCVQTPSNAVKMNCADEMSSEDCESQHPRCESHHPLCSCTKCSSVQSEAVSHRPTSFHFIDIPFVSRRRNALHLACLLGKAGIVNALVNLGAHVNVLDSHNDTPLHIACSVGKQSCALLLLHLGALADCVNYLLSTPMHLCAQYGHCDCAKALLYYNRHMTSGNMNLDTPDTLGNTPLHYAVINQHADIVLVLLECGASTKIKNNAGESPVDLCNNAYIAKLLIQEDPSLDFVYIEKEMNNANKTMVEEEINLAMESGDLLEDTRDRNALYRKSRGSDGECGIEVSELSVVDAVVRAITDKDLPLLKFLLGFEDAAEVDDSAKEGECHPLCQCFKCKSCPPLSVDMTQPDSKGDSPLFAAVSLNRTDILLFLLDNYDMNLSAVSDDKKGNIIHITVQKQFLQAFKMVLKVCHRSLLDQVNMDGLTPLHLACTKNLPEFVRLLIEYGANPNTVTRLGETALHIAASIGCVHCIHILIQAGANVRAENNLKITPAQLAKNDDVRMKLQQVNSQ